MFRPSNVVGYQQQTTRAGFNYMTPTFVAVDGSNLSVQDLQLDETVVSGQADVQILDENGVTPNVYYWYTKAVAETYWIDKAHTAHVSVPEGKVGVWLKKNTEKKVGQQGTVTWYDVVDITLDPGDSVQINTAEANKTLTTAGAVPNFNIVVPSIAGFNYVGNPFPVAVSIQDIQLDETVISGQADVQILDKNGVTPNVYYWYTKSVAETYWLDKAHTTHVAVPEGNIGVWLKKNTEKKVGQQGTVTWYDVVDITLNPGDGVQVNTAEAKKSITLKCPAACK